MHHEEESTKFKGSTPTINAINIEFILLGIRNGKRQQGKRFFYN